MEYSAGVAVSKWIRHYDQLDGLAFLDSGSVCWPSSVAKCKTKTGLCKTRTRQYCKNRNGLDQLDGLVLLSFVSEYWPSSLSLLGILGPYMKPKGARCLRICCKAQIIIIITTLIQRLKATELHKVLNVINEETVHEHLRRWWAPPGFYTAARWTAWCSWSLTGCTGYPARASLAKPDLTIKQPELDLLGARWMAWHFWSLTECASHQARATVIYSNVTFNHGLDLIKHMIIYLILNVNFDPNND